MAKGKDKRWFWDGRWWLVAVNIILIVSLMSSQYYLQRALNAGFAISTQATKLGQINQILMQALSKCGTSQTAGLMIHGETQ